MSALHAADVFSAPIEALCEGLRTLPVRQRLGDADATVLHTLALELLSQGRFAEAERRFVVLLFYRPDHAGFRHDMGYCLQMQQRYLEAGNAYALAAVLERDNPSHLLAVAECDRLRGDLDSARCLLGVVADHCAGHPGLQPQAAQAQATLALLGQGG